MSKKTGTGAEPPQDQTASDPPDSLNFEAALEELEGLVQRLEAGDLSLEDSLAAFERGVKLTRRCQAALKSAELRVKVLTEDGELKDFNTAALDDD